MKISTIECDRQTMPKLGENLYALSIEKKIGPPDIAYSFTIVECKLLAIDFLIKTNSIALAVTTLVVETTLPITPQNGNIVLEFGGVYAFDEEFVFFTQQEAYDYIKVFLKRNPDAEKWNPCA